MEKITMKDLVNYAKTYGFIYQGSEIYGGLANTWDYGILGARLKNNLKDMWRKFFIQLRDNAYEIDASILMHPKVWEASGHVKNFSDPLLDCKECKMRVRADKLIEEFDSNIIADKMTDKEMFEIAKKIESIFPLWKNDNILIEVSENRSIHFNEGYWRMFFENEEEIMNDVLELKQNGKYEVKLNGKTY